PCSVQVRVALDDTDLLGLWALLALGNLELDPCPVIEGLVAVHVDRGEVDEHVLPTVDRDKAVALLAVEPLDGALRHCALPHCRTTGPRVYGPRSPFKPFSDRAWSEERTMATDLARYRNRSESASGQIGQSRAITVSIW